MTSKRKKVLPFAKKLTRFELIGSGSFGKVYKVTMRENGALKDHALKVVQCNSSENTELALRESRALSHLTAHSNIVKFKVAYLQVEEELDQIDPNNKPKGLLSLIEASIKGEVTKQMKKGKVKLWFQMEYCNRGDMNSYLLDREPSSELNASVLRQLAKGICFLHENNIIHRDLKPENVLVNVESNEDMPVFKIADFGLSKVCTANGDGQNTGFYQRVMSSACGSEFFMAPEVFDKNYTPKADVFSLGIIFWAVMDRITFISAGTQKLLLGTYVRVPNKEVIPVGEALLDDPSLDVRKLMCATSKRRPYKREDLYNADKSCTLVMGNVVKLRELVGKMILKDADLRPSSQVFLKKLEAALKPSPRAMACARKAAAMSTHTRKTRFSMKKEAETKIKVASAADLVHPEFLKDATADFSKRVVASPPSSPIRITRNKKLSTKGKHVTGVVHTIVGDVNCVDDAPGAADSQEPKTPPSVKTSPHCSKSLKTAPQLSKNTRKVSILQSKALLVKKNSSKSKCRKFAGIVRALRSGVTKRQKSLRSYNYNTELSSSLKTWNVPPKKRQKRSFCKVDPTFSSVAGLKSNESDNADGRLLPQEKLSSSTSAHSATVSDFPSRINQSTEASCLNPEPNNGRSSSDAFTFLKNTSNILSTRQRMSLMQQINETPKQKLPTLPKMSDAEKAVLINHRKRMAEAMMLKHLPDDVGGHQSSVVSIADFSQDSVKMTKALQNAWKNHNFSQYVPILTNAIAKVTYTTTTARTTHKVQRPPLRDESGSQDVLPSPKVSRPPIKVSAGGKRKKGGSVDDGPIIKVRKFALPCDYGKLNKVIGFPQTNASEREFKSSSDFVTQRLTPSRHEDIPIIDLTGSSKYVSHFSGSSNATWLPSAPVVSAKLKHSQVSCKKIVASSDHPLDLRTSSSSQFTNPPQTVPTSRLRGPAGVSVFPSEVPFVSTVQVPLPPPSSIDTNMQANHLVASHVKFSAVYDNAHLSQDLRAMQGYPPWHQNSMSGKERLMAPH